MYSQSLEDSLDDLLVSWEVIEFIPSLKLEERKEIVESRFKKKKGNSLYLLLQNLTELSIFLLEFWKLSFYHSGHIWV